MIIRRRTGNYNGLILLRKQSDEKRIFKRSIYNMAFWSGRAGESSRSGWNHEKRGQPHSLLGVKASTGWTLVSKYRSKINDIYYYVDVLSIERPGLGDANRLNCVEQSRQSTRCGVTLVALGIVELFAYHGSHIITFVACRTLYSCTRTIISSLWYCATPRIRVAMPKVSEY